MDTPWPYYHGSRPPLSGRLKSCPADFVVEEIPAYLPTGTGEHLFLWIEKVDTSAEQLCHHLARTLHISPGDIGVAGLKDRRAITRQWVSVPAHCAPRLSAIDTPQIHLLASKRHPHKLRTGHLKGNRFQIVVRDLTAEPTGEEHRQCTEGTATSQRERIGQTAQHLVSRILQRGFPNYYGEQRFGRDRETWQWGYDLLIGAKAPCEIPAVRRKFFLRLALSAAQADLFNRALAARLADGLVDTVLAGDVMEVVATGGKFLVEDPLLEQPRCDRYETVITGPMFGPKMRLPRGVPWEREQRLLVEAGLSIEAFRRFGKLLPGTRRPYLVRPSELHVAVVPEGLQFVFTLPPGAYATMLLREVLATEEGS